ncbi:hypothetical protein GCM10027341_20740 [Spirosoma knui]
MPFSDAVQLLLDTCSHSWFRKTIQAGDFVYQPADVDTHVYILEQGLIKIGSLGEWGQRVLYDCLQPQELFGNLDYLDEAVFFEYAQAATSVSIITIDRAAFRYAVTHNAVLASWFAETIIRRWHRTEVRLLHRNSLAVEERIRHLRAQYSLSIPDVDGRLHRPVDHLSYQEIGDLVGATRQTVSRWSRTSSESPVSCVSEL